MSDLMEAPVQVPMRTDEGEHEKFAHVVVPAHLVTEAYVTGSAVTAVCGKVWVPNRDPKRYPLCPDCEEFLRSIGRKPDGSKL